jgi:hypothetical protein
MLFFRLHGTAQPPGGPLTLDAHFDRRLPCYPPCYQQITPFHVTWNHHCMQRGDLRKYQLGSRRIATSENVRTNSSLEPMVFRFFGAGGARGVMCLFISSEICTVASLMYRRLGRIILAAVLRALVSGKNTMIRYGVSNPKLETPHR